MGTRVLLRPPRAGDGSELTQLNRESARLHRGRVQPPRRRAEFARGAFQSAYLGYYVGARFARQDVMTEALELVLAHAFGPLGLHRVEANIQPGNTPSIRLVRRAGFTREGYSRRYLKIGGRRRDHERWALLREVWRGGRRASRSASGRSPPPPRPR